jgi:hypothetical protein
MAEGGREPGGRIRIFARIMTLYAAIPRDPADQQVVNAVLRFLVTDGGP